MAPPLPGPLAHLAPLLEHYGYAAVGGLVLVEDFGVPAPGETILIAAAVYAGAGQLNIFAVGAVAVAAAVVGDNIGYLVGRSGGRAFVHRWGRYVLLTPERFERAEQFFVRHGAKVVTIARFVEGLRQANGIIAGTAGMHWRRFLFFNTLGAVLWVGLWAGLGYAAGTHIGAIYQQVHRYQRWLLIGLGVLVAALIARHLLHRRRTAAPEADAERPPGRHSDGGR
ncbi:DedA family protein [Peterkaempfera bronchialis]|uniref:DedA family protein n=1 Tax=Peterkaempfera bronchialis TaxID=2126346 RepID=A0A345SRM4_9ACTN|nr:DedA family protein [Peterkaempfera bronchialis]AXI76379.1 DedA family protein [Peterkaempfera bronchialis]